MKISNETKVGLLSITALTLLILGFNFLKGRDLFNRSNKIYMVFPELGGLTKSNEVKINGFVIGKVYDLEATDKDLTGIVATVNLTKDVNIPKNSTAVISSTLLGTSYIDIQKGDASAYLERGDTLEARLEEGLLDDVKSQLTPTLAKVREGIDTLKILLSNVNKMFTPDNRASLQHTLSNLSQASHNLNTLMDAENGALARSLNNVSSITENLRKNNDSITATISNARMATAKLASLELQPTLDTLNAAIVQLKSVVAKIDSKEGSLGALINDKQLYNKLIDAILSAEILMDDLRTNPKRYVNLSIFGKKDKKGPITSPAKKDTLPPGGD